MPSHNNQENTLTIDNKTPLIILIGAPGSGKGTQAAHLVNSFGIVHISTGDMLRAEIKKGSPIGVEAKTYIDKGELVPDSVIISMLKKKMDEEECKRGVLLDGFPRTVLQAQELQSMVSLKYGVRVLFLDVEDESVVKRISGRRSCPSCNAIYHVIYNPPSQENSCDTCKTALITRNDDKEETVRARLTVFHNQTAPVVEFYRNLGILTVIDGEQQPENVRMNCFQAVTQ